MLSTMLAFPGRLAEEYRAWDTEVKHKKGIPSSYKCNYRQFVDDIDTGVFEHLSD